MTIGKKIREMRKKAGLTQKELGKLSNTSETTIKQYELDKRQPRIEQLKKIANVLNVKITDFLEKDEDNEHDISSFQFTNYEDLRNTLSEIPEWKEVVRQKDRDDKLLSNFRQLNETGQAKAIDRVAELTEIPRYTKKEAPARYVNAAHSIDGASEEDKQHDENIMNDDDF
ncbi:MAG: helix-turn-helix domain-containing protein [Lachnospiraceae bacterium]|nr:helix-turn-helix domain-containing protein [Lachnospiraceae bacterium]